MSASFYTVTLSHFKILEWIHYTENYSITVSE